MHRRRPQRQVAGLRAGQRAGHRPAPDRDVLAADPYRRPRRGRLRPEFDALDAFLSHTWAVTVTGAPKLWAMQFIEDHERSPRALVRRRDRPRRLRRQHEHRPDPAHHPHEGRRRRGPRRRDAALRLRSRGRGGREPAQGVGAARRRSAATQAGAARPARCASRRRRGGGQVLLVDHEDSFVHTLANYFRTTGAEVTTLAARFRAGAAARRAAARSGRAVAGAGPARRFRDARDARSAAERRNIPIFGVCLGLQGIVEYFGGSLGVLDVPMHGKPSPVRRLPSRLLRRSAGALHGRPLPLALRRARRACRRCWRSRPRPRRRRRHGGRAPDACRSRRCSSIPESVLTSPGEIGMPILEAALSQLCEPAEAAE